MRDRNSTGRSGSRRRGEGERGDVGADELNGENNERIRWQLA